MGSFMSGNGQFRMPRISAAMVAVVAVALAVVIGGFTSLFVVDQSEEAVITTLGRFNRVVGPGLQARLPFGIEQAWIVPTQITQNMEFGIPSTTFGRRSNSVDADESVMLTGDLNIVDIQWIIQFNITDPLNWLFKVDNRTKTIQDISISVMNELVGDRSITDVLGASRTEIETNAVVMMNSLFDQYGLGIRISDVKLQNIVPPQGAVSEAFEDVNRAMQDQERMINEGRKQYNEVIPKAKGEAQQLIQTAAGYAAERVNMAKGDVARFESVLALYRQDPQNTRLRLYNEMMEDIFAATGEKPAATLLDKKLDNAVPLLNLPGNRSEGAAQ